MKMVRIMNELFLMFLDRTIIGSYVIAIVLVFRYFLKKDSKTLFLSVMDRGIFDFVSADTVSKRL